MSSALDMMPPAPANSSATASGNQKGTLRDPRVHVCVSLPVFAAAEGVNVVEDMFSGLSMRDSTNERYGAFVSFATMCAPIMNI